MGNFQSKPPSSNTGVTGTSESGLRACVDWVQVTFKMTLFDDFFVQILKLDKSYFTKETYSFFGFEQLMKFEEINVLYTKHSDGILFHLMLSGLKRMRKIED